MGDAAALDLDAWRVAALTMMRQASSRRSSLMKCVRPELVRACAALGVPEGRVRYGRMLLSREGVAKDETAAFEQFALAAQKDHAEALNMLGRCHENGWGALAMWRALRSALRAPRKWATRGAQYNYAHLLLDGEGVAQDRAAAFLWYGHAAAQGHARAMSLVGRCHEEGWGTARDPAAARAWYKQSAEGDISAAATTTRPCLRPRGRTKRRGPGSPRALESAPEPTRSVMGRAVAARSRRSARKLSRKSGIRGRENDRPPIEVDAVPS